MIEEDEEEGEGKTTTEVETNVDICSFSDAKCYVHELRRYFESSAKTTDADFSLTNELEQTLSKNLCQKQSSILYFFKQSIASNLRYSFTLLE